MHWLGWPRGRRLLFQPCHPLGTTQNADSTRVAIELETGGARGQNGQFWLMVQAKTAEYTCRQRRWFGFSSEERRGEKVATTPPAILRMDLQSPYGSNAGE